MFFFIFIDTLIYLWPSGLSSTKRKWTEKKNTKMKATFKLHCGNNQSRKGNQTFDKNHFQYSSQNHHALLNNFYLEKWWILTLSPVVCMLNSECGEYISLLHNPSLLLHNVIFQSGLRNCICAGMTERETLLRWMSLKKETSRHFYHIHWLCSGENKLYWNHIWERNILY